MTGSEFVDTFRRLLDGWPATPTGGRGGAAGFFPDPSAAPDRQEVRGESK